MDALDIVLPNAGIMAVLPPGDQERAWQDSIDVMLTGVWHMIDVSIPGMIELHVPQKDQTLRAHVQWRRSKEVGVTFHHAAGRTAS